MSEKIKSMSPGVLYMMFAELIASAPSISLDDCVSILSIRSTGRIADKDVQLWHAQWLALRQSLKDHVQAHKTAKELEAAGKFYSHTPQQMPLPPALDAMLTDMKIASVNATSVPSDN